MRRREDQEGEGRGKGCFGNLNGIVSISADKGQGGIAILSVKSAERNASRTFHGGRRKLRHHKHIRKEEGGGGATAG